jgi:hypothetical protein
VRFACTIDGPPPIRHDPTRCADRTSPNAIPLFAAAAAKVADDPQAFPIRQPVGVTFVSAERLAELDGYDVATAIEEVLVDAGVPADERLVEWEDHTVIPEMTDRYTVLVEIIPPDERRAQGPLEAPG